MSKATSEIKVNSWAKKTAYLRSRLDDHKEIYGIYEIDFTKVIRIAAGNIRVKQDKKALQRNLNAEANRRKSIEEIEKETAPQPGEKNPKRALYRKIALETHPDRQGVLNRDSATAEKNEELFKRAQMAHSDDDIAELLMIAHEIDLSPLDFGMSMGEIRKVYAGIEKSISQEIKQIENSYIWIWGESVGNIPMRINLLDAYLRQTGHPPVDQSLLRDIIEHHETKPDITVNPGRQRKTGKRPKKLIR